jgi:transposase
VDGLNAPAHPPQHTRQLDLQAQIRARRLQTLVLLDATDDRFDLRQGARQACRQTVADIGAQRERVLPQWSLAPVVDSLVALRGIDKLAAMVLLAELGDISRFDSPRQLM